jgi:hypothetical protein
MACPCALPDCLGHVLRRLPSESAAGATRPLSDDLLMMIYPTHASGPSRALAAKVQT